MAADLQDMNSQFDAEAEYAAYVKKHGESARKLREAAATAATMRFRIHGGGGGYTKVDEYLPLTQDEVAAVREILAQIEEIPARDFSSWLKIQHENHICPVSAPPPYWLELQFVSATGEVLYYWEDYNALTVRYDLIYRLHYDLSLTAAGNAVKKCGTRCVLKV